MPRLPILFLLLLSTLALHAQDSQARAGWGLSLEPSLSGRRLVGFGLPDAEIKRLDSLERNTLGYGAGLFYSMRGEKVGVQIGLNYVQLGYDTRRTLLPENSPYRDGYDEIREGFRSRLLELPFSLLFYQSLGSRDDFYFLLGANAGFALSQTTNLTLYNESSSERISLEPEGDFRRLNFAFRTGMGWEHLLGTNWVLSLQPTFTFWLNGVLQETLEVNRNLYSLGLRVAVRKE